MAYNGMQGDPQNRVICANCHANNFAGQAQCWQCHAPLAGARGGAPAPPARPATRMPRASVPEPWPQQAPPFAPRRSATARPSALLLVGVGMMAFVIALIFATRPQANSPAQVNSATGGIGTGRSSYEPVRSLSGGQTAGGLDGAATDTSGTSAVPDAGAVTPDAGNSATNQPANSSAAANPTTGPTTGGGDPLEDAAKRVISREAPNVGQPPTGAVSSDGQVHLRSGGSISVDDWNAAKRKLQDNPLLKDPPAPPPF
jgi:hypothetical protein